MKSCYILGGRTDVTTYEKSIEQILAWARTSESRYVCFGTVHMIMEAYVSPGFRQILNDADLVNPDGMPLVWVQRRMGTGKAQRVTGPDITLMLCEKAATEGMPVGFYGGSQETNDSVVANMRQRHPGLNVSYAYSPPFRPLTPEEDEAVTKALIKSGTRLLFIGLGCPKQEQWMREHRGRIPCVMLGVGAMFDFHAGTVKRAPLWLQDRGLEWLYRLLMEPKRLWKRYLTTNLRFIALVTLQLLGIKRFEVPRISGKLDHTNRLSKQ
jgi:N-acetylglucosaminyldiphosphoundecaprenol N-acetyl-beta-D-mannosaminyltransferase